MTVKEIGSAIRNNISDGLKGEIPTNSYSREQLIDQAFIYRNRIIMESSKNKNYNLTPFYQTVDAIPIAEFDLSKHKNIKSGISQSYIKIPILAPTFSDMSIEYIGPANMMKSFKIYYDTKFAAHSGRLRTAKNPFAYVDMGSAENGYINAILDNLDKVKNLRYLSARGIWANPLDLKNFDCCSDMEDKEFPAPLYIQDMIIEKLTERFIRYYRQMNIPEFPNTQTDVNG